MGSSQSFAHLHLHTQYSLLDGAIKIPDLMRKTADYGLGSVAMTDHGNLFGAVELLAEAKKFGVKGIVGCETYLAPESRHDKKVIEGFEKAYHLVLLCQDEQGYKNLCKLVSLANIEGFYYRPRIDKEILRKHSEGLIATSSCLAGEIPNLIGKNRLDEAKNRLEEYLDIFGDRFYLEIQKNGIELQEKVNRQLIQWSKEYGVKLVATGDCHYLNKEDAKAHEVLLCVQTGSTLTDPKRYKFDTNDLYYKTAEEIRQDFADVPEACDNTLEIAERCDFRFQSTHHFPVYRAREGENLDTPEQLNDEMERQAREGYERRLAFIRENDPNWSDELAEVYDERFQKEIDLIKSMQFASYFLIVSDFIVWAKKNGIPVGPGRGSAAGSLVAFAMSITDIDPIRYNLLFERFLNPERVSMPDIDVDFCQDRRGEVIKYVTEKYGGPKNVTQIITFGEMKAKSVIRDVGRAMAMPLKEVDKLAKMVPADPKMTLGKAMADDSRFDEMAKRDSQIRQLLDYAKSLEGLKRNAGIHAAGIVIADKALDEYLPLYKPANKEEVSTSFEMKAVEKIGLIKFDFLGLKTLSIISYALKLIEENYGTKVDLRKIDMLDQKTYELLRAGQTACVFQLESGGMRDLLRKIRPGSFEDIIAVLALYRPGPLQGGMVDDFIARKHGKIKVDYPLPELEPILQETYGVIVYQEQVMQISRALAGYSLGQADLLRRAMGKKDASVMEKEKVSFLDGAKEQEIDAKKAEEIFDLMAKFAEYGFNKSHSAAYALISYQTAYLKAHYPKEFMAAVLSYEVNNTDKVVAYSTEARDMGIPVLPPHVNRSYLKFTTDGEAIRFGMAAIRGAGDGAIEAIIEAREADGPFEDVFDLCARVDTRKVNRKVLEALVQAGAFDDEGKKKGETDRAKIFAAIDPALEQAVRARRDAEAGQFSMFGQLSESAPEMSTTYPDVPPWPENELLAREKVALGMYMSSHPLNKFADVLKRYASHTTASAKEAPTRKEVRVGVMTRLVKEKISQRGGRWGIVTFEDMHGSIDTFCFSDVYQANSDFINSDTPLFVIGEVDRDDPVEGADGEMQEARVKLIVKEICLLEEVEQRYANSVQVTLQSDEIDEQALLHLRNAMQRHAGNKRCYIRVIIPHRSETLIELPGEFAVAPTEEFFSELTTLFGKSVARML